MATHYTTAAITRIRKDSPDSILLPGGQHKPSARSLTKSPLPSARTFDSILNHEYLSVLVQGTFTP